MVLEGPANPGLALGAVLLAVLMLLASPDWCGTAPGVAAELVALHLCTAPDSLAVTVVAPADRDVSDVAILEDRGDLVARKNPFDLDGSSLRFTPNRAGGYDVARLALAVDPGGDNLGLGDNDVRPLDLPFGFPFFGERQTRVYVHSDGDLTFGGLDPSAPSLARFLEGPPRIAGFLSDLDPSRGGSISARLSAERAVFVWSEVPGAFQQNHNTFEIVLQPSGVIDVIYGATMQTREGIVGVSPGGVTGLDVADLSAGLPLQSKGALVERFSETEKLDLVSVTRRFFRGHPDVFDQLVVYTTRPLNPLPGSLAFEINVRNAVSGLGLSLLDDGATWGSQRALSSVVYMDVIDAYLDVDGFEFLAHEVGHRWLAYLRFRDQDGTAATGLLGRGLSHWSFLHNSDASVLEGNRLVDHGGGRFETVDITRGYSALDQYAMGLRSAAEVPPFYFVADADNFRPNRPYQASSAPEAGVSFTGLRRDVRIEDVIAAIGPRAPEADQTARHWRQAYILVADSKAVASGERIAAVSRIRSHFEPYYREATGGRGAVTTQLEVH